MNTETEVPDNADYEGDEAWQETPEQQLDLKKRFLDGVIAEAELLFEGRVVKDVGRYNPETAEFLWQIDDQFYCYNITTIVSGPFTYRVILGTTHVLGQIFLTEH